MQPKLIRSGTYTIGGSATVAPWTLATNLVNGELGQGPVEFLGFFDLKPWQNEPRVAAPDSYRRNVIPLPDGGRVRLSPINGQGDDAGGAYNPIAVATAGAYAQTQLGAKTSRLQRVWAPDDFTTTQSSYMGLSLMVASCSTGALEQTWDTSTPQTIGSIDTANTPGNVRAIYKNFVTMGPEILSDLSGPGAATYDLEDLSGGNRFVGVWLWGYWIGPQPSVTQTAQLLTWDIEDCPAPPRTGPVTYGFPVRAVQNLNAASVPGDSRLVVAQWPMQRAGVATNPKIFAGSDIPGCRVAVVNGANFSLHARIEYHIGQAVDRVASALTYQQVIAASTATLPIPTPLPTSDPANLNTVIPPYSYANLVLVTKATQTPDGVSVPAIVFVSVG